MASVFLEGTTVILNPAKEPEIVDLQNFLNMLGANIKGAGTDKITICGVKKLGGGEFKPICDRIVCGTLLIACAMCGGKISLIGCKEDEMESLLKELRKSGCKIDAINDKITIESIGKLTAASFVETSPYPGFPTDLQSQFVAMQAISRGSSTIRENLFETRFGFVGELKKMGAKIDVQGQTCNVCGVDKLIGTEVYAGDLRGGAALVLAGLCAEGQTTVCDVFHIDRGYDFLEKTLSSLGAKIIRQRERK
jgi:UDP-N-acetylglucosamine 1-carboxyvinyltransferase